VNQPPEKRDTGSFRKKNLFEKERSPPKENLERLRLSGKPYIHQQWNVPW